MRTRILGLFLVGIPLACVVYAGVDWYRAYPIEAMERSTYVGRQTCAQCHESENRQWMGSHHQLAMQVASAETVLANFDGTSFQHYDSKFEFSKKPDGFYVRTQDADGELRDFKVKYTFGAEPLQQYMVEFPDGRIQVMGAAWDVEKKEWFFIPPPDAPDEPVPVGDPMHWTGMSQNWNTMCAECHSTGLEKNFDLKTDTYQTTFHEIDVSCEACHGPGSLHVELANNRTLFWDRNVGYGLPRLKSKNSRIEIDICAACHSRRSIIQDGFRPGDYFLDYFEPALLREGLYYADGQILDEVYVYGSFLQSQMHAKGVRCTDCHNPHSLELKFEGNRLCAQCHQPGKYDTPLHHHHETGTIGAQCVECHMPDRHYMVVDPRRDHSFRIPRPDLSVLIGTPNACNDCHQKPGETFEWAAQQVDQWYGEQRRDNPHWALAIAAGRAGDPQAAELLLQVVSDRQTPAIVRATAVELLAGNSDRPVVQQLEEELASPETLVRLAAVRTLPIVRPDTFVRQMLPMLEDIRLSVRMAAALRLQEVPDNYFDNQQRAQLADVLQEYRKSQSIHLERAASHMNLGNLDRAQGNLTAAEIEYRTAIEREPYLTGPRSELAAVLSQLRGDPAEIDKLRREELRNLQRDADLLPDSPLTQYRLGLTQYLVGELDGAERSLRKASELAPHSYDFLMALALLLEYRQDWSAATEVLRKMNDLRPDDPMTRQILMRMMEAKKAQNEPGE